MQTTKAYSDWRFIRRVILISLIPASLNAAHLICSQPQQQTIIIDHKCTDAGKIPSQWVQQAKATLRLSYGHTSHGSQPVSGMATLKTVNSLYDYLTNGSILSGKLSLADTTPTGDLGNPDRTTWASRTREYLNGNGANRNVVVWSWCGQVSNATTKDIDTYLNLMQQLENDFPAVTFVYMTGHLDGTGANGNLAQRNNQIRTFCRNNNKVLFDFADIESYDPLDNYYPNETDACGWCSTWCSTHPQDCQALPGSCAHSHGFNCWRKANAFWWMLARLAGWDGVEGGETTSTTTSSTTTTQKTTTTTISTTSVPVSTTTSSTISPITTTTLPYSPLSAQLEFPQIAAGGGYVTYLYIGNPSDIPITAQLDLLKPNGQPLVLSLAGEGILDNSLVVAPRNMLVIRLADSGSLVKTGWARIIAPLPLAGLAMFQCGEGSRLIGRASVFPSSRGPRFFLFLPQPESEVDLGLALANPGSQVVTVRLRAIRANGILFAETAFQLNPGEQRAKFLTQFFSDQTIIPEGALELSASDSILAMGLLYQQKTGSFSSIPVIPWE